MKIQAGRKINGMVSQLCGGKIVKLVKVMKKTKGLELSKDEKYPVIQLAGQKYCTCNGSSTCKI